MTARPEGLIESPRIRRDEERLTADPLSAVLQAVRLEGAVWFLVEAHEPWAAEAPRAAPDPRRNRC